MPLEEDDEKAVFGKIPKKVLKNRKKLIIRSDMYEISYTPF
jgi:hypothetical protein